MNTNKDQSSTSSSAPNFSNPLALNLPIERNNLMSLEAWSEWRKKIKSIVMDARNVRTIQLGEHLRVQFESEATIRYQIQEMLRIEKTFEAEGIQSEIDAYRPLVPMKNDWRATMMLEYPVVEERRRALARLVGIASRMYVEIEGTPRVYALADEDLDRETDEKTSAVHFLRFVFSDAQCASLRSFSKATLGCDHVNYPTHVQIAEETLISLVSTMH